MTPITFFQEDIAFELPDPDDTSNWINSVLKKEGAYIDYLNFIFCSDAYLHQINIEYLNHDTLTDIVTFDNSDNPDRIEGDIFISIERIKDNGQSFDTSFDEELHRVIIHGVLHLIGFNDKTDEEKSIMREKEEACLSLRNK
ncbi:MAG: rRNA maturation RNase YbeY [Bacteroidota bacterium]